MAEATTTSSSPQSVDPHQELQDETPQTWIAYHNTLIIGYFNSQDDATQALRGYEMDNNIALDDVTGVNQLV